MPNYRVDQIVDAKVVTVKPYGALLAIDNVAKGLLHISEISSSYVSDITDYFSVGDTIRVEIIAVDEKNGFLKFSLKSVNDQGPKKKKKYHQEHIDESEIDFTPLKDMLPVWIAKAKEQKND